MAFEDETPTVTENNLNNLPIHLYVYLKEKAENLSGFVNENLMTEIPFTKYKIKETDMRVKTMSFTSPIKLDLTIGVYLVKLVTTLHENFVGEILTDEFTENTDGTYTYQCQDMSRQYQSKFERIIDGSNVHKVLQTLLTKGGIKITDTITNSLLNKYKLQLAGLRPIELYQPSLWGNTIGTNMFEQTPKLIIRNTTYIQAIRDICNSMGDIDVYFDSNGTLQIEPISLKDWQNTGLYLTANETSSRKFKFDTTNAITGAIINATDKTKGANVYTDENIIGLNLKAFFGKLADSSDNPVQSTDPKAETTAPKTTTNNSNGNPFNNKAKKILVSADGGSADFRSSIINLLKNDGWTVTDLGTGPGTHSASYNKLSSSYSVNLTIYNGCDPETIKEPVTGWLKGKHEQYGVTLVQMFDTRSWTNPNGMKPYRYGDFTGYTCHKAWDDNYSGKSDAQAKINDLGAWYKQYRKQVLHCAGPSPSEAYAQFKAGGYLKYKGL